MENSSKLEIISNIKDKISQFRANYSKNKSNNQKDQNFNFEINRDTLQLYKNKKKERKLDNQHNNKNIVNLDNLYDIKNPAFKTNSKPSNLNINNNCKKEININHQNIYFNNDLNKSNKKEKNENNSFGNLELNKSKYKDLNIQEIMNNKKIEKREKSAPRISINNFHLEIPLTDKNRKNKLKNNNFDQYYNKTLNDFYTINNKRAIKNKNNNTEEKIQKLLIDFNINLNSGNNKRKIPYLDLNSLNNNNYNNFKNVSSLYEISRNISNNNYTKRDNYSKNISNFDLSRDRYKKITHNTLNSKSLIKEKMDLFYQELNKNTEYNKKNISNKNYYFNYNDYLNKSNFIMNEKNTILENNLYKNNEKRINNRNSQIIKGSQNVEYKISVDKILNFKKYVQNLTKEEIYNLPYNIQSELKDIYNILNQKLNN